MGFSGYTTSSALDGAEEFLLEQGGNTRAVTANALGRMRFRLRAVQGADQTIPDSTWTTLLFNTQQNDDAFLFDVALAPGVPLLVDATTAGVWVVGAGVSWASNATGIRQLRILENGTSARGRVSLPAVDSGTTRIGATAMCPLLNAGEYVTIEAYQNSGGDLDADDCEVWATRVGAPWA